MTENGVPDEPPAAKKTWHMPGIILGQMILGILLVGVAAIVVVLVVRFQGESNYEARVAEIEAAGYPATLEELDAWYAEVPDDENAAIPLLKAFDAYQPSSRETIQLPWLGGDYAIGAPLEEGVMAEVQAVLAANDETLELIAEALIRPDCRFPIDFTGGPPSSLPYLAHMRSLGRLLALQATVRAAEGDGAGAAVSVQRILGLSACLKSEPIMISQLVRVALRRLACEALEDVMARVQIPADGLVELGAELAEAEDPDLFMHGLIGEQAMSLAFWREAQKNRSLMSTLGWILGIFQGYRNTHFDTMAALMDAAALPIEERQLALEREFGQFEEQSRMLPGPYRDSAENLVRASLSDIRSIAQLRAGVVACAVERYQTVEDEIPSALRDLVPVYLREVPTDPFTGEMLRYRTLPEGYVVYSIGEDSADSTLEAEPSALPAEQDISFMVRQ